MYSFGELPWKQSQGPVSEKLTLESSLSGQQVVAIAAGSYHSGAVTQGGGVHMWGDNGWGQCGLSALKTIPNPTPVALLDPADAPSLTVQVLELACGARHTLALSARREVWAWGSGCQLGLNTTDFPVWKPQKVQHLAGRYVLQVACGAEHSLALVRCLGHQEAPPPPVDKCRQCNQLLYTMTDKEDHVIISDSHYCALAVEHSQDEAAQEALAATPTQPTEASPSEAALPSQSPQAPPPASAEAAEASSQPAAQLEASGSGSDADLSAGPRGLRSSLYPDEQAVKDYLKKLSDSTQAKQEAKAGLHALLVRKATSPTGRNASTLLILTPLTLCPAAVLQGAQLFQPQLHAQQPGGVLRLSRGGTGGLHLRGAVLTQDDDLLPPFGSGQVRVASGVRRHPEQQGSRAPLAGGLGPG